MTYAVPAVDLENVRPQGVRAGTRELGALAACGRPEQIAAWRDGTPYVAEPTENSAGR